MRLTLDLLDLSVSFVNTLGDRELDLRGNKLVAIENMSATRDTNDAIDISDNDIKSLDGFAPLNRVKHLYASNNRISRIDPLLATRLPSLETLILNQNLLSDLSELKPLGTLQFLKTLALLDNPVSKRPHYRLLVIDLCPLLRTLDYERVTAKERREAKAFSQASTGDSLLFAEKAAGLAPADVERIQNAIAAATSLEEITVLEKALSSGYIPEHK